MTESHEAAWDRLSAQDHSFLVMEDQGSVMHVGAVQIFSAGKLATPEGGIDVAAIRHAVLAKLPLIPRYRQKLAWTPIDGLPIWVDDPEFDVHDHVRHVSLPRPGTEEQLMELAERLFTEPLDRSRPLWDMVVVEGLEDGRYAMINRVHHAIMDGTAGSQLANLLYSLDDEQTFAEIAAYEPRPAPSTRELLTDTVRHRAGLVRKLVGESVRTLTAPDLLERAASFGHAMVDMAHYSMNPVSDTPLTGDLAPKRAFRGFQLPLADVKAMSKATGTTINDVVLAAVSGGVREHLIAHGLDPAATTFRFSTPVNVRAKDEKVTAEGNRVSSWIVPAPLSCESGRARLEAVHHKTAQLKQSDEAAAMEFVMNAAEYAPNVLLPLGSRAASGPISMVVTNVPGPAFPLFMQGSKLDSLYCQGPILPGTGICLALFSYAGQICFGFNANAAVVRDLEAFVGRVKAAFTSLQRELEDHLAAGAAAEAPNARTDIVLPRPADRASDPAAEAPPAAATGAGVAAGS